MERSAWKVTGMCALVNAVGGGLGWAVVPPLLGPISEDLKLSHAAAGLVWGAAPLGIALAAPLGGTLVDRIGPRRVVSVALVLGALACASRALVSDALGMALAMFAFGVHVGFAAPAIPKALAGHVPIQQLGRANGIAVLGYTLATAATVLLARTWLLPMMGSWRAVMVFAGAAMLLAAAAWALVVRDGDVRMPHAALRDVFRLARDGQVRRLAAMQFLLFGGYLALLGLLPRTLVQSGLAPAWAGVAVAGWLVTAGIANLAGPWLSDRLGVRRPFMIYGAIVAGAGLSAMAFLPAGPSVGLLLVAALGGGCFAPLLLALPMEMPAVGPTRVGAALGLLLLVGQIGGFLLPVASGLAIEAGGFPVAMLVLGVAHLAILVPVLGFRETGRAAAGAGLPVTGAAQVLA